MVCITLLLAPDYAAIFLQLNVHFTFVTQKNNWNSKKLQFELEKEVVVITKAVRFLKNNFILFNKLIYLMQMVCN